MLPKATVTPGTDSCNSRDINDYNRNGEADFNDIWRYLTSVLTVFYNVPSAVAEPAEGTDALLTVRIFKFPIIPEITSKQMRYNHKDTSNSQLHHTSILNGCDTTTQTH